MIRPSQRWVGAVVLAVLGACMPPIARRSAFSSRFTANDVTSVGTVARAVQSPGEPAVSAATARIAAVQQGARRAVVLVDAISGRTLWNVPLEATSTPELLGDLVVVGEGRTQATALDATTGARRWSLDTRTMPFMGAARDGGTVVLTFSQGGAGSAVRAGQVLGVDAASGRRLWTHEVVGLIGRPAAAAGLGFVPWDRQSIAVLSMATGVEQARLRATDDVLTWVTATPTGVYYGGRGIYRWTDRSASGRREESAYLPLHVEGVPGDPPVFRDAFFATTGSRTARDKIRFGFRTVTSSDGAVHLDRDTIFLAYYRFLLAFDANSGALRWGRAMAVPGQEEASAGTRPQLSLAEADIEALAATEQALFVITAGGTLDAIDPSTGAILGSTRVGEQLGAYAVDAAGLRVPASGAEPAPPGGPIDQLVSLVRDADHRLVPMRAYLVRLLAAREEPAATRELLDLYRSRSVPGALKTEISQALRQRRTGAEFLIGALDDESDHFNFLENRQAPPLDVIAPTLANMEAREAVPVLLQHLLDHETPAAYLPPTLEAIARLGDATVVPQLRAFIQRYRADSTFAADRGGPLVAATDAIFRLGDAEARAWLTQISDDAAFQASVRAEIHRLFDEERGGGERRTQEAQLAQAQEQLQGELNALRVAVEGYPQMISNEQFESTWASHLDDLRECAVRILERRPDLNEIRVTVTLRAEPPAGLFETQPPATRLAADATFEQRLADAQAKVRWATEHRTRLEAYRSMVRTLAYSPQDPAMQECMDRALRPVRFPGFGRGIASRTFQQRISTVRSTARQNGMPGFGTPRGTSLLVPWFLVSSPTLDTTTGRLIPMAPPPPVAPVAPPPPTRPGPPPATAQQGRVPPGQTAGTPSTQVGTGWATEAELVTPMSAPPPDAPAPEVAPPAAPQPPRGRGRPGPRGRVAPGAAAPAEAAPAPPTASAPATGESSPAPAAAQPAAPPPPPPPTRPTPPPASPNRPTPPPTSAPSAAQPWWEQ